MSEASLFDATPLWLLLVVTVAFILLVVEGGYRAGIFRGRRSEKEREAPIDAMVGAILGLLAFMLAFTFGMATSRDDTRKQLVLDEAIAIRIADLRAQLLPEPHRSEIRALLREYVDVRVEGVRDPGKLQQAIARSEELHDQLWSRAAVLGQETPGMAFLGSFVQSLTEMIGLHAKRVSAGLHNRLSGTIWIALYSLTALAMGMMGYRAGMTARRSAIAILTLAVAFSAVIVLIADLDRTQEGMLKVSQQAMVDLQSKLNIE